MDQPLPAERLSAFCRKWLRDHEFARFLISGAVNTVTTYLIYVGLVLFLPYPVAYTITTALGILLSYYLNARFVFRQPLRLSAAVRYPAVYGIQYVLGLGLLYFLVEVGHLSKFIAPVFIVLATVPVTFVLSRLIILRNTVPRTGLSKVEPINARFSRLREIADSWLISWTGQLCLAIALALIYFWAYRSHGALPGANTTFPLGWWGWWDQGAYWRCAAQFAQGNLTPETYWYPLGYPALGALFYRWMPQHAFLIPDLFLVVGAALLFFQIARRFISPVESLFLIAIFIACYHGLLTETLVVPWNTIPTHFLSYLIVLLAGLGQPRTRRLLIAAVVLGLIYLCRPGDALCLGLLLGWAILRLPSWRERIQTGLACGLVLGVFWLSVQSVNLAIFDARVTPYEKAVAAIGFGSYPILQKLYWLVVDSRPLFNEPGVALASHFPWLLLIIPGAIYLLFRRFADIAGILLSVGATYLIYFEFNDLWPGNMFLYHVVHYFVWTFPLLALIAYVGIRDAWRTKAGLSGFGIAGLFGVALCLLSIRPTEVFKLSAPVPSTGTLRTASGDAIDWILFSGPQKMPKLFSAGRELAPMKDFVAPFHPNGLFALLSREARRDVIEYGASETGSIQEVQFGRLSWRFESIARKLRAIVRKYLDTPPSLVSIGKSANIDLTGPAGLPDGTADQVIELDLPKATLRRITTWDLRSVDGSAHWSSAANLDHWWLIKALPTDRKLANERTGIRLCLPDFGQLKAARSVTLRGLDNSGGVVLELPVRTESDGSSP
jgi:putative flippase GtrA